MMANLRAANKIASVLVIDGMNEQVMIYLFAIGVELQYKQEFRPWCGPACRRPGLQPEGKRREKPEYRIR